MCRTAARSDQSINLHDLVQDFREINFQVNQLARAHIENPAVHLDAARPVSLLDARRFDHVDALLLHVQLHQSVVAGMFVRNRVQLVLVQAVHVADVAQPRVQDAQVSRLHGCFHPAAVVVAAHHDVLHLQVPHRVVDHRHHVQVDADDHVGNVAVDEYLAGHGTHQVFRRHPAIGASDVEHFWILPLREVLKIVGVKREFVRDPFFVVGKNFRKISHVLGSCQLLVVSY